MSSEDESDPANLRGVGLGLVGCLRGVSGVPSPPDRFEIPCAVSALRVGAVRNVCR